MIIKNVKSLVAISLVIGLILVRALAADAYSGASSSSSILWDQASFTLDPGMSIVYSLQTAESTGNSVSPSNFQNGYQASSTWGTTLAATSLADDPYNFAVTTALTDTASILQNSLASANLNGSYQAYAQSLHAGMFSVVGTGTITITVPYDLSLQVFADSPDPAVESASGMAGAGLYLFNSSLFTDASDYQSLFLATPGDAFDLQNGVLTASLFFNNGDYGSFQMIAEGTATASSVPEPSTIALVGVGLAGVALFRKRFRA